LLTLHFTLYFTCRRDSTMPHSLTPPLGGPPPPEVSLSHAPLAKVVAQARFAGILKIDNKEGVAGFQDAIRREYPLFEQATNQQIEVQIGPGGPNIRQTPGNAWRFSDAVGRWRLTLVTDSLTLETEHYTSRTDFVARWASALAAIERTYDPQIALRIGMRYISRVNGKPLEIIDELVNPDILGVAKPPMRTHLRHILTEAILEIEEGQMLMRWGQLPANGTIDPNLLTPIPELSWILDIDVFSGDQRAFSSEELRISFQALAERAYSVFRYMTTDRFLETYGGKP
jgi:uncharacterized protein (TIGR04255 family)